jgi:N-acetylglucosaminyl-diphospho-decaprenol L-rhamnosyltransferase
VSTLPAVPVLGAETRQLSSGAEVAVIIVTYNSDRFIRPCLASLAQSGADVIVVDNGSVDDTKQIVRDHPQVKLIEASSNLGYGKAINLVALRIEHPYLVLSNADVIYGKDTVAGLISLLKANPEVGVTAPQQVSPAGDWQLSYADAPGILSGLRDALGINSALRVHRRFRWPNKVDRRPKEVGYVAGAVLALPRQVFSRVNGFDEKFHFYGEESDLCIRLRRTGWKVVFNPLVEVVHHAGGHSTNVDRSEKFYGLLIQSQVMLAKKYLSPWRAHVYLRMRRTYFQELALAFRIVRVFVPASKTALLSRKIWVMDTCTRLLTEQLVALKNS